MDIYDIALYVGYFLAIVGVVAAVLLPLINSLGNPRSLVKTGVAIVALLVIFGVAYAMSDNEVTARFAAEPFNLTPGSSQFVGGLLMSTYFLFIIAFLSIFVNEISKQIR
ncbi:MAG TPA: hypothetical protein VKX33_00050 [Cyclobacteriaceae bacterium]|nr:hypothetical protein [Cyclobacteriaceae bacterium]